MTHLPLFRVRSWNNGMCSVSFYILISREKPWVYNQKTHFTNVFSTNIYLLIFKQAIKSLRMHIWIFCDLTHCGRVTHICVGNLTMIGPDNGLSPGQRQAIIWTNAGILFSKPLETNFSEILIKLQTFSFKKIRLKTSILSRPQWVEWHHIKGWHTEGCWLSVNWVMTGSGNESWCTKTLPNPMPIFCQYVPRDIPWYNLNQNTTLFFRKTHLKIVYKMSTILFRSQWVNPSGDEVEFSRSRIPSS